MTKERLKKLRDALESAGFALIHVEDSTKTNLCYDLDSNGVERFEDQSAAKISTSNHVYIDAVPLFLPLKFIQK
jgi:hypothetical protein